MLLDTYAWVEFFNGTEKGRTVKRFLDERECFTPAIVLAELSEWIENSHLDRKKIMETVLVSSFILNAEQDTLEAAGILKVKKRQSVKGFGLIDAIILATALQYNLTIVTGDKHFGGEKAIIL